MDGMTLVWVDARHRKAGPTVPDEFPNLYELHVVDRLGQLASQVESVRPDVIIFDYDYPDLPGLQTLRRTRRRNSTIPVLMLTDQHYENLAIWALRCRVWDYLIKPIAPNLIVKRLDQLRAARAGDGAMGGRDNLMPAPRIPVEARLRSETTISRRTDIARAYVKNHLEERIPEELMAQLCGMSRYEFSRVFKHEHGMTFRKYLLDSRLERASEMLSQTDAAITDVALSVSFQDLSHFAHLFRRHTGCTPSQFRRQVTSNRTTALHKTTD